VVSLGAPLISDVIFSRRSIVQLFRKFLRALLFLGLVGCSTTGGEFGGLFPLPKITEGTLADGRYTAKDNSFSVKSPFEKENNEYTYMKIEEHYSATENHIVFSSSAASAEVYRVDIYKNIKSQKLGVDATELEKQLRSGYTERFQNVYKTSLIQQRSETISVGPLQAISHAFVQQIPERSQNLQKAMGFTALHTSYFLEDGDNAAFIWINRMSVSSDSPYKALIARSVKAEERVKQFINSFRLNKI
jgi:hypothetical protein